MNRGYIKFWRKAEDSVSWTRGLEHRGMMVTILDRAAWKPRFEWGIEVQPGEFLVKVVAWAETLGMSQTSVRRILKNLVEDGFISVANVANRYTKITVLNWHIYQEEESASRRADGELTASTRLTNGEQTASPSYKEEEGKKERRKEKNTHPLPLTSEGEAAGLVSGSTSDCAGDSDRAGEETPSQPQAISPPSGLPAEGSLFAPPGKRADSTNPRSQGTNQRARRTPSAGNSAANLRAAMEAYTCNAELRQALEGFRVMRERLRKPLTARAFQLTCAELDKLAGNDEALKAKILDQSVQRGWQGVFALKPDTSGQQADRWAGAI